MGVPGRDAFPDNSARETISKAGGGVHLWEADGRDWEMTWVKRSWRLVEGEVMVGCQF